MPRYNINFDEKKGSGAPTESGFGADTHKPNNSQPSTVSPPPSHPHISSKQAVIASSRLKSKTKSSKKAAFLVQSRRETSIEEACRLGMEKVGPGMY